MYFIIKKVLTMLTLLLSVLATILVILFMIVFILSPGKPDPLLDTNGNPLANSISEKVFVNIGRMSQGMFIKSKNRDNPVLLYLHGGIPDYFLTRKYPTGLEDHFTVVWWEQRSFGLSYDVGIPKETMTLDQMISDTKEVTNYLRTRFGKEKIYIMGRSGGTFIGIQTASRAPELFHAYIGIGQMSDQLKSEQLAYDYILQKYREAGNGKMVRKLEASPVRDTIPGQYLQLRDRVMHDLGIGAPSAT